MIHKLTIVIRLGCIKDKIYKFARDVNDTLCSVIECDILICYIRLSTDNQHSGLMIFNAV